MSDPTKRDSPVGVDFFRIEVSVILRTRDVILTLVRTELTHCVDCDISLT